MMWTAPHRGGSMHQITNSKLIRGYHKMWNGCLIFNSLWWNYTCWKYLHRDVFPHLGFKRKWPGGEHRVGLILEAAAYWQHKSEALAVFKWHVMLVTSIVFSLPFHQLNIRQSTQKRRNFRSFCYVSTLCLYGSSLIEKSERWLLLFQFKPLENWIAEE